MNAVEYLGDYKKGKTIVSKGIVLARYCTQVSQEKLALLINHNLLSIVYSGSKFLKTAQGDITINAGEAFFLPKGEYVFSEVCSSEDYSCLVIFFDDNLTAKLFSELPHKNSNTANTKSEKFFKVAMTPLLNNCADSMVLLLDEKFAHQDELMALKLKEMMLLLLEGEHGNAFLSFFKNSLFGKCDIVLFMEENFDKNLNIAEFAKLSGRSLGGFKKEFQKYFGEAPSKWLLKKRLERGRFLIEQMGYAVGSAAINSGFKSHAHFSRLYKQEYKKTPSQADK